MLSRPGVLACSLSSLLVVGCQDLVSVSEDAEVDDAALPDANSDEADAGEPDAAQEPAPAPEDAATAMVDAAADAAQVDAAPDGSDASSSRPSVVPGKSFESALRVEPGGIQPLVDERAVDQVDYFVFRAEAGSFYELSTDRSTFSPDNVISLFDADRKLLAFNDDGPVWAGDALDARLVVHIAKAGDYYIKVEDPYTPADFFGSDFALLYYYLNVRQVTGDTPGYARVQPDGLTEPVFQHDSSTGYDYVTLLGLFGAQAATCSFTGRADHALIGHVSLGGSEHDGSSFAGGQVRVARADGNVMAEIDRTRGQENIHPPIGAERYSVQVHAAGAALGDNPYYTVDLVQLPDNPREQGEATNGALTGAEQVIFSGRAARRGLLLSRLPAGDVDYYRVELAAGDTFRVSCEAESAGSGIRGLTAEVRDAADAVLVSASESVLENLGTEVIQAESAGSYYLRLSGGAATAPTVEPWVRCALLINR